MFTHEINEQLELLGVSTENDPDRGFYCSQTTSLGLSVIWGDGEEWHVNPTALLERLKYTVVEEVSLYGPGHRRLISIFRDCQVPATEF